MLISLFVFSLLVFLLFKFYDTISRYPPGPRPLPLLGNLHHFFLGIKRVGNVRILMHEWKKDYGGVFTIWFGPIPMVMIGDYGIAQESFGKKGTHFMDRQQLYIIDIIRQGRGILISNGEKWKEQRRFALQTLRDFGLGKNIMEERVMMELNYRTSLLDKKITEAGGTYHWNPLDFVELAIANIINRILFSERFTDEKEAEFFRLKKALDQMVEDIRFADTMLREFNKNWPILRNSYKRAKGSEEPLLEFIKNQIRQKKENQENHGAKDDFVDAYLEKIREGECSETFDEETLAITLLDLWLGGQASTTATTQWAFVYLTKYKRVREKLQKELDEVTGRSRPVSLTDRPNTPYLNAVVQEILRVSSVFPINLARLTTEDTTVGGYKLQKGTPIVLQMSIIMSDEEHFNNPYKFNPDRYFQGESDQYVLSFSLGKRACPGEALARTELYLIIGNMVQSYNLDENENNQPKMEAVKEIGVMRKPFPFEIILSKR